MVECVICGRGIYPGEELANVVDLRAAGFVNVDVWAHLTCADDKAEDQEDG